MPSEYSRTKVQEILNDKNYPAPLDAVMSSAWILGNLKGENLKVLKLSEDNSLCDYFVMASAKNSVQLESMRDEVIVTLKEFNIIPFAVEGTGASLWILLDFGDFFVHLFQEEGRSLYDLDKLYESEKQIEIPQDYYFKAPVLKKKKNDDYF